MWSYTTSRWPGSNGKAGGDDQSALGGKGSWGNYISSCWEERGPLTGTDTVTTQTGPDHGGVKYPDDPEVIWAVASPLPAK